VRPCTCVPAGSQSSAGRWTSLAELADALKDASSGACTVAFGSAADPAAEKNEATPPLPHVLATRWLPRISLHDGLTRMLGEYAALLSEQRVEL
jgi:hypothetical protein